jgi:hypothetical protein
MSDKLTVKLDVTAIGLDAYMKELREVTEHPLVHVDDNGYVISGNGRSVFLSPVQALELLSLLSGEIGLEYAVPEATALGREVEELRAEVKKLRRFKASVPWRALEAAWQDMSFAPRRDTEGDRDAVQAFLLAHAPEVVRKRVQEMVDRWGGLK